jgi:hypothetical protein
MRRIAIASAVALLSSAFVGVAVATPIPNPAPTVLANDLEGTGYFTPSSTIFSVEIFDVGQFLNLTPTTFGFFFSGQNVSNPANLIPIFETTDLVNNQAAVNFGSGIVVDVDQGVVQNTFSGSGNIGFYVTLNAFGGRTLFSDPLLNGGTDYFGAFPFLSNPTQFGLNFYDTSTNALIHFVVVNGLTPAVSVPEPSSFLLLSFGLLGLGAFRRASRRRT